MIIFLLQGYPGEKGAPGSSDIVDFNGKLLDAFQVSNVEQVTVLNVTFSLSFTMNIRAPCVFLFFLCSITKIEIC